ncbi:hypothetical protein SAMN05216436_1465 [bacterium A37T11]|nr:hypothetical protein SAMN05216436_1465 [bacterium A37T11]
MKTNVIMKYLLCILFVWNVKLGLCQSDSLLRLISLNLSREMDNSLIRGRNVDWIVIKDSTGQVHFNGDKNIDYSIFQQIIMQQSDSLVVGKTYRVSIYFDLYSSHVYPIIYKEIPFEGFPNFDNLSPSPKKGYKLLLKSIYADLYRHRSALHAISLEEWNTPMDWLIDSTGTLLEVRRSRITSFLDSSLRIPWWPAIYHGWPMASVLPLQIDKDSLFNGGVQYKPSKSYGYRPVISFSYLLSEKYREKWVYFDRKQPTSFGELAVSFVFNPITQQLENPVIHAGNELEALQFIAWLKTLYWPSRKFYWPQNPYTSRYYLWLPTETRNPS